MPSMCFAMGLIGLKNVLKCESLLASAREGEKPPTRLTVRRRVVSAGETNAAAVVGTAGDVLKG